MTTYVLQQNTPATTLENAGYSTISQNGITDGMTGQNMQAFTSSAMGVGGGIGDDAVDVTYSTKPSNQIQTVNYALGSLGTTGLGTTTTTTTINNMQTFTGNTMATTAGGNIMGFGLGGDAAMDVTYSTKPDNQIQTANYGVGSFYTTSYDNNLALGQNAGFATTTLETNTLNNYQTLAGSAVTTTTGANVMGFGQGGDAAIDVTYSTKPDNQNVALVNTGVTQLTTTTDYNTTVDVNNLQEVQMYNKTTLLPEKVQHIVQKEYQPIVKTVIKPIIQREYQPIVEREIRPIIQQEVQPIVEREIQPIIQREIQSISKKEIQPIIQQEVQPIVKREIQPIVTR